MTCMSSSAHSLSISCRPLMFRHLTTMRTYMFSPLVCHACSPPSYVVQVCPAPHAPPTVRNATCMQEGFASIVLPSGAQQMQPLFIRTDVNAETAMALAFASSVNTRGHTTDGVKAESSKRSSMIPSPSAEQSRWAAMSAQLFDYMFLWSASQSFTNASDATHGIVWWNQMDAGDSGFAHWAVCQDKKHMHQAENLFIIIAHHPWWLWFLHAT